jgi:hypothetical protein
VVSRNKKCGGGVLNGFFFVRNIIIATLERTWRRTEPNTGMGAQRREDATDFVLPCSTTYMLLES